MAGEPDSLRLRRIERDIERLMEEIIDQQGDDPERFFICGEPATDDQKRVLGYILDRLSGIMS